MRLFAAVVFVLLAGYGLATRHTRADDSISDEKRKTMEQKLMNTRKTLLNKLDRCTLWRDQLPAAEQAQLHSLIIKAKFESFREMALRIAKESYPDAEDCLKSVGYLVKKYNRILTLKRRYSDSDDVSHIEEYLSPRQLYDLHKIYRNTGRRSEIVTVLSRYFDGMGEQRKKELIEEFFAYKSDLRRKPRHLSSAVDEEPKSPAVAPVPQLLNPDWLGWMNVRQKSIITRLKNLGADKWEIMNTIAEQFYHQRKEVRKRYDRHFQVYCSENLEKLLGHQNFDELQNMYLDNDPVDQIETRFHEMVGDLRDESTRLLADHYGAFCRKIYRLVHFEPTDLTTWLSNEQKQKLGEMIRNPEVGDQQVYQKVYEFFSETEGEQKEEARDTIDTGCRHFIAHMFGDDTAEELEDLRLQGNISSQILAARLARHAREISSSRLRRIAQNSLPMCTRIYLGYDGSCVCNGHSSHCDIVQHTCSNCTGGTFGVQCEQCLEGFSGDATKGDCTSLEENEVEVEATPCSCSQHSQICDAEGKCVNCEHNTEGNSCERCIPGYYGDATAGSPDDCTPCPCPNGVSCYINEDALVQCSSCPAGKSGFTCDDNMSSSSEENEAPKS